MNFPPAPGRPGAVLLLLAAWPLFAQISGPPQPSPASRNEDERVVLSPFVVRTDKDSGYQATSTLAGTRLNTPLKDLAASISVYTKDFLEDIGATNSNDLLIYATGMEAAGLAGGNFSGATNDINLDRPSGDDVRVNPQGSSRTRGLASPTFTRGYFGTSIAMDSYNSSSVTVNRGPNAVLFGVGSAAGVVDTALSAAELQGNRHRLQVRFGNNGSWRESLDVNRVLVPGRLAARFALLDDRDKFNQRPAFETKRRAYGALTFEPWASTSLRANFESGNTTANRPITSMPYNSASDQWFAAGRPSYDWTYYDDPVRNPNARNESPGEQNYGFVLGSPSATIAGPVIVYNQPYDTRPANGFLYRGVATATSIYAANSVASQIYNPLLNRDLAGDTGTFLTSRNVWELPAGYWTGANVAPGQQPNYVPAGVKAQTFGDFKAFDFKNRMIDETSRQGDNFHSFNVALAQTAWQGRAGVELAYDQQYIGRNSKNSYFSGGNSNHIYIDVNVSLPTGLPNPNLGRPFAVYGQANWTRFLEKRDTARATAFLKYDFKDLGERWGRWLGRHTLTGIYEDFGVTRISYRYRVAVQGALSDTVAGNIFASSRRPAIVTYLGPSVIGNNNPLRLEPITAAPVVAGVIQTPMALFVREANTTDPGRFVDSVGSLAEIHNGGSALREVIRSKATALQSYWLQNHLITTLGWRRDTDYFVQQVTNYVENPNDRNDPGKVHYGFGDFAFPRTPPLNVSKAITSYGAVLLWPRRLLRLPPGTDLSAFYNSSSNFTPSGGRINAFGEDLGSPQGRTREYGFNASAFSDRLSLRVNWFETAVQGASYSPSFISNAVQGNIMGRALAWSVEGNNNPQLAASRAADVELLFSRLPANFRDLYGFRVTGTSPNIAATGRTTLPGSGDTTDYTAKGTEADLVFNPTRGWRILANVARQETVQSNSLPFVKRFFALMKPVWDQLSAKPSGAYPSGYQLGTPLPASVQTFGQYLEINNYVPFATAIATEGSASAEQRKWRANLVTNYTFSRGGIFGDKLKGWGVGGAARWQDKLGLGYPSTRAPNGTVSFDLAHPYYAPAETNIDAWVSYERQLAGRIKWKVQLNLRNLFASTDPIGTSVQSWNGRTASYRLAPERRWYLNQTFDF